MRRAISALWLAWAVLAAAGAAACPRAQPAGAERAVVPAGDIDQALLNRAVLAEINYRRCRRGLGALQPARPLTRAAAGHSRWMAATGTLSHRAERGLAGRLRAAGIAFDTAAENIGMLHRYPVDRGPVRILDRARCRFARDGRALAPRSYAGLARRAVALWMASRGHRRHILDPRARYAGTAVAFSPGARYCGRYWLTQAFVG